MLSENVSVNNDLDDIEVAKSEINYNTRASKCIRI